MPDPKKHHYHPKFLLKEFCADNQTYLFVYDLQKNKIRKDVPDNVASEIDFYSILDNGVLDKRLENYFAKKIEGPASKAIKKFKKSQPLSTQEKIDLANFIALARIRTPFFIQKLGEHKLYFEQEFNFPQNREIRRDIILQDPKLDNYWKFLSYNILQMNWSLVSAPYGKRFITSDNPLCSILKPSQSNRNGFKLEKEFQDPTLRLYLPLSKEYAWLGHFEDDVAAQFMADNSWMAMFERNCVIWGEKYIYASIEDEAILKHAMKYYRIDPFDIDMSNLSLDSMNIGSCYRQIH